jgi:Ca2+-binding RTX toxin-like protein
MAGESPDEGTDEVRSSVTYRLQENVENLTLTGTAAINGTGNALANAIIGNDAANVLAGLAGNDTLSGLGGNDTLDGGVGADAMAGGAGDDIYVIDSTGDAITEASGEGTDEVRSPLSYTLGATLENLSLSGTTAINAYGNEAANVLTGNSGNNELWGQGGDDTLIGLGGNDILHGNVGADAMAGGAGNDTYYVENAGDTATEASGAGTDSVYDIILRTTPTSRPHSAPTPKRPRSTTSLTGTSRAGRIT